MLHCNVQVKMIPLNQMVYIGFALLEWLVSISSEVRTLTWSSQTWKLTLFMLNIIDDGSWQQDCLGILITDRCFVSAELNGSVEMFAM